MKKPLSAFAYLLGSAILLAGSAIACSSSSSSGAASAACAELTVCCLQMPTATSAACTDIAMTGTAATCASTLVAFAGQCGAATGIDAGHTADTGTQSCIIPGSCTTTNDSGTGTKDTGTQTCEETNTCPGDDAGDDTTDDAGDDAGDDTTHDAGTDADVCGTTPVLHPETAAGVYCPFSASGSAITCTAGQQCCETPSTTTDGSTCEALGTTCPVAGSIDWTCQGPLDCADSSDGPVCCGAGTVAEDATCGFERGSGFQGTHCATQCESGEVGICSATSGGCASGTCTPFKVAGLILGTCQ